MLNEISNQFDIVLSSLSTFFNQLASFVPKLLGALFILLVGWIIAKVVKSLSEKLFKLIRLDKISEKAGINSFLKEGGIEESTIKILGKLFYWLIMFFVFLTAFNSLGLQVASDLFNEIVQFIPNVIVAVLILIFGLYIGQVLSTMIVTYLTNIGVNAASAFGKGIQAAFIFLVVSMVLKQMNIGGEIVPTAFLILFASICLALALSFGLGGRDWASDIVEKYLSSSSFKDKENR